MVDSPGCQCVADQFKQQIYTIICLGNSQVCMLIVVETKVSHLSPVYTVQCRDGYCCLLRREMEIIVLIY